MKKLLYFLKTVVCWSLGCSYVYSTFSIFIYKIIDKLTVSPDFPKYFEGSFIDELSCNTFCSKNNCTLFTLATLKNGKKECAFYNFLPEEEYMVKSDNTTLFINKCKLKNKYFLID